MLQSGIMLVLAAAGVVAGGLADGPNDVMRHQMNHKFDHASIADDRLDRLKALVGEWEGDDADGDGVADFEVHYRLTGGGHAVIGTQFPGTPMEMVNLFHLDGDDLILTHYCAIGNQPRLKLETSDEDDAPLHFTFQSGSNMASRNDQHMGELVMTIEGDTIHEEWTAFVDGKDVGKQAFTMTRKVKAVDDTAIEQVDSIIPDEFEQFFMVVLSAGPKRTDEITDEVTERQAAHMEHLTDMHNDGLLVLAGPFGDSGGGGMLVLRVETMEQAQALMDNDPHVKAGWLKAEIRPWLTQKGKL